MRSCLLDELSEIANKYSCEKYTLCDFTQHYDKLFNSYRDSEFNLIEIGVSDGRSMRMWEEYFRKASIYGIDTDPMCLKQAQGRIHVRNINQCDTEQLKELCDYVGKFFIACDDGSHIGMDMIDSFNVIYPYIENGGFYIIEDVLPEYRDMINKHFEGFNIVHSSVATYRPDTGMFIVKKVS